MKILLFALSLFFLPSVYGQINELEPTNSTSSKFTYGWIYSPEASYRILSEGSESDEFTEENINFRNGQERAKFGQTFAFFLGYKLSNIFTLEGGWHTLILVRE